MKKFSFLDVVALVVWLLPLAYLYFIYDSMPKRVPLHWGLHGTVDRYGNKSELLSTDWILLGAAAFVYLLLRFISYIDPKKQVKFGQETYQKLAAGVVIFLSALNIAILFATAHQGFQIDKLILPLLGLMFVFLGNILNSIKPNYFAGFRTPWALENEDNWRATHRLVSKMWFFGGILITILTLILPPSPATVTMISIVAVITIIPFIYSYWYFKKQQVNQNS